MRKAYFFVLLCAALILGAAAATHMLVVPVDQKPELQYGYIVRLDPVAGGPAYVCDGLPQEVEGGFLRIKSLNGAVVYVRQIPLFITRSAEPIDLEALRRSMTNPPLGTQEASGPPPSQGGANG